MSPDIPSTIIEKTGGSMRDKQSKSWLQETIMLIPNLVRLLFKMMGDRRVRFKEKIILLGTILYVISPLDFVPDFVPFLGYVDDILLLALIILRFMEQAGQAVLLDNWQGNSSLLDLAQKTLRLASFFLPPSVYNRIVKGSGYQGDIIDVKYRVHKD